MPFHPSQTSLAVAASTAVNHSDRAQLDHAIRENPAVVDTCQNRCHQNTLPFADKDPDLEDDWELDEDLRRARQMVEYRAIVKSSPSRLEPLVARGAAEGLDTNQVKRNSQQAKRTANFERHAHVMETPDVARQGSPVVRLSASPTRREAWVPIFFAGAGMLGGLCAMTTAQMWPGLLPIVLLAEFGLAVMITMSQRQWARIRPQP